MKAGIEGLGGLINVQPLLIIKIRDILVFISMAVGFGDQDAVNCFLV